MSAESIEAPEAAPALSGASPASSWVADAAAVDLWRVDLARVGSNRLEALSEAECERAARKERLRGARAPAAFGPSRAALREILGRYVGVAPASVEIKIGEHDRPALAGSPRNAFDFNLSHSGDCALVVVGSSVSVGVDIERVDVSRDTQRLAARFFTDSEREAVDGSEDPVRTFFRFWTCKEAYLKAIGTGLSRSPRSFEVELSDEEGRARVSDSEASRSALLCELQAGSALAATVCTIGAPSALRIFDAAEWVS